MPFEILVPKAISRAVGRFGISPNLTIRLFATIHDALPVLEVATKAPTS